MPNFGVVLTPEQLDRVGAFRYQIYIEELGKTAAHADYALQKLIEPADRSASSMVFYLEREDRLIATLRVEFLGEENGVDERALAAFGSIPTSQMIRFTRLMVVREERGSSAAQKLLFHGFALALLKNRRLGLLTCRPDLVPVFETYGCMQYADAFTHAESGPQVPMAILGEVDYLRARAAPLASWLVRYRPDSVHAAHFMRRVEAWRASSVGARGARTASRLIAGNTESADAIFA